ncbi:ABC-2 type transporter-domain-containing protein [Dactylonectria macrodidyma]|uniref:ABC-2 type transporter-domain-containing protein n=1 Tax=Dactylonectria macrodidyma TaxID=307937 RepID=A0A9P9IZV9_9HYPO|nr:ABC-2 type transporter-domain-containing protein [Dactylonectria macrodidyma]
MYSHPSFCCCPLEISHAEFIPLSHQHTSRAAVNERYSPDIAVTRDTSDTQVNVAYSSASTRQNGEGSAVDADVGDEADDPEEGRRNSIVQALATAYTSQSHTSGMVHPQGSVFLAQENPESPLNPQSPKFKARAWAKEIVKMMAGEGSSFRTSGICYQNLNVFGFGAGTDYQKDVANVWLEVAGLARKVFGYGKNRIDILRNFDGVLNNGEMLVVLGPPGSGCSTFLKAIAGETNGIYIDDHAYLNYQGLSSKEMLTAHRGEAIYTAEVDVHFPMLTVGETLTFASRARIPRQLPEGLTPSTYTDHLRDVVMAMFGISHTKNTRVGNEYVRGVSGGERKRVTISEAALSGAPLQCWDNSTRGLDSANAIEFCKTLRLQTELFRTTCAVSIYQAPQAAYDLFDKVVLIYEGRQIFFGPTDTAKQYFIDLGYECAARQTTPDFLTSITSPKERIVRSGFETRAPRTPDEFATAWKMSDHYKILQSKIEEYKIAHPINGPDADTFRTHKQAQQARGQRAKSPFMLSYGQQIHLCLLRAYWRLAGDPSVTVGQLIGNIIMGLIVASVFYDLELTTDSFYQRGALLFFAVLMNAFSSALEILTLYAQRSIVEKHDRYAFYHPSAEAVASALMDMPYKILNTILFSLVIYFMTNLRREPGAFFYFLLVSFFTVLVMSGIFRSIASASRTLSQAMVPAALLILALVMYTGFVIPIDYMLGWSRWMNYIDPVAYAFESLMINEFAGRDYLCTAYVPNPAVPGYENVGIENRACSSVGSEPGKDTVAGTDYITSAFQYYPSHKWRNVGIIIGFTIFFNALYVVLTEIVRAKKSKGEVLVFRRGYKPAQFKEGKSDAEAGVQISAGARATTAQTDEEKTSDHVAGCIPETASVFHWRNVCYDVKIKSETRRILDHVDGWVKPGTLTALMGVSGAGKTTLLDCLADRAAVGVITGEMLVNGKPRDASFQRKTGYVQQQDLHLETTTVREALNFSALLRQPAHIPRQEKLAYVEKVIALLDMQEYADAVVGVPGVGLNVEQRKRLTIGVELAAKPPLLVFVDEPTSGLDSQTSWAILDLLEKLTKNGQAVLCTIHQPSAMLFQRFDRLLLLAKGGKTVYFGDVGKNSEVMTAYFERHGAPTCPPDANPAEWMLEAIGAAPGSTSEIDWPTTWRESSEQEAVLAELHRLEEGLTLVRTRTQDRAGFDSEFAAPFLEQLREVTHRVFQQYWRTPSYIYSKASLCILISAFIGFSFFDAPNTLQGLQNQTFAIFNLLTIFGQLVQQTMPYFVVQRSLYEVRERPSKVYSWKVFICGQIIVEIPWNTLMAVFMFVCFYYPIGLNENAKPADQVTERGALMFLLLWAFLMFTCTFTDFIIAGFNTAEAGANVANMLFMMCLMFCGILANPDSLPGFWIFMYRISPFTYMTTAMMSAAVANTNVVCAPNELVRFATPTGQTCGEYLSDYILKAGGYIENPDATDMCAFCTVGDTNKYLAGSRTYYSERWRNFGIFLIYIVFNMAGAVFIYWLTRVPKKGLGRKRE